MTGIADCIPSDPEDQLWDVVVIGTGAGGATAGFNLARQGRSVLFLECGKLEPSNTQDPTTPGWSCPQRIMRTGSAGAEQMVVGCGTGGSTAVFSMVMDRFRAADLAPRQYCPEPHNTTLPDTWPIPLSELQPHYARAESLFRVRGTTDPLCPEAYTLPAPTNPTDADTLVHGNLLRSGLHPYRLHYARENVHDCTGCFMSYCRHDCRNDAGRVCVRPALLEYGARILPECQVERLKCDNSREVRWAMATWRGRPIRIEGRTFVLALNAIFTPALLLRSVSTNFPDGLGNSSGMVGRNLMTHVSDNLVVRMDDQADCVNSRMRNGVSLNDFYVHENVKLGNVHAHAMHFPPALSARLRGSVLFSTIVEDFPYFHNRVVPRPGSETDALWEYHYAPELRTRAQMLRNAFVSALDKAALSVHVARPDGQLNPTHMCGTCRFGDDPHSSVLDRNNRMHDVGNVYVVDASFFPSSGAMNPSLTIVANSLRVSDLIARS